MFEAGQIVEAYRLSGLTQLAFGANSWVVSGHIHGHIRIDHGDVALVTATGFDNVWLMIKGRVIVCRCRDLKSIFRPILMDDDT